MRTLQAHRRIFAALLGCSILLVPLPGPAAEPAGEATSEAAEPGWQSAVRADLAAREYHITWQDHPIPTDLAGVWHAPNRAHGFRTYFTERGIRVLPRTEATPSWEWGLSWIGYGRGGRSWSVPAPTFSPDENRITYRRGAFEEFYENDARGLKQGFVLPVPPEALAAAGPLTEAAVQGRDTAAPVHLDLALSGSLSPRIAEDGQAVDFVTAAGIRALRYTELRVTDARGVEVRAWMEGFSHDGLRGLRLVLDPREAVYPVTIDPLATNPAWTAESDQVSSTFAYTVATAGDVNGDGYADVVVGAYLYDNGQADEGRAFSYHGSAAGLATSPAWTAESDQATARFGRSVATAGDVNGDGYADILVGAYQYDNGQADEGRAFAYHGSAAGLAASPAWTAEADQANALFGNSVAAAGDVNGDGYADVLVGAHQYDNGQTDEGRAFAYHGSAAGLATSPAWTAESDQATAFFGYSVGTAGDVTGDGYADVIVGAILYDNGESEEGRAFAYHGSVAGLAASPAWTSESDQVTALFGGSVGTAGDVNGDGYADVIVGADSYDNGHAEEGRASVYHGSATGLATSPAWTAESDQTLANFGLSVATGGDVNGDGYADVIVGAHRYDNDQADEGRAFAYLGSAAGLATDPAWTAESNQVGASFGASVATAGDVNGDGYADVLVGAYTYDNGQTNEGRAFTYYGSAAGLATSAGWTAESGQASAEFGLSVAAAGDVNGDGYADVVVGALRYDNGQADEGRAFAYHGSAAGMATSPAWTAESDQAGARFASVTTAGDVNGDGYADVVVGALWYDNGQTDEGRVFAYHGSATGLATSPAWTAESDQAGAEFGLSVATAGDVNGDGYADVLVGAHLYDNGETDEGRAFAYHGSAAGLATTPAWTAESDQDAAGFAVSVATAGDVNGDGYADVVVGAYTYDNGQTDEGRAFAYHGSVAGLSGSPAWTAESNQVSAEFGISVATAGDVSGDGYADVLVGAHLYDNGQADEGRAFAYHGSVAGLAASPNWTAESDQVGAFFGVSVATAGDVNGDGHADVLVGAESYDNGQADEGRAFVYHGSAAGLATSPGWTAESDQAGAIFGVSAATAGDVNGDGYADVLVGAYHHDNNQADEGAAFLYYGNAGPGLSLNPRQRRATDVGPIAHLGASDSPDGFRLNLLGRSPFGRGRAWLEWEVKELGKPLNGINTKVGVHAYDTGSTGVELSELETGLVDLMPYHWRVRLRYDLATTPFAQRSRWLTAPWKGWQETMLLTADPSPAGSLSWLTVSHAAGVQLALSWNGSCRATDTDYAIYEGVLGDFTSHEPRYCGTGGGTTRTFTPLAGSTYYLVVPLNATREGSYGTNSAGVERPQGLDACLPQQIGTCP